MNIGRICLNLTNRFLRLLNLRLDTLTASRAEADRLREAYERQGFSLPEFPVSPLLRAARYKTLLAELPKFRSRFDTFENANSNDVGYQFDNPYFHSPDTEILYAIIFTRRPSRILEIGCGHSTKVIRQAIRDAGLKCEHIGIDPQPREETAQLVDAMIRDRVETFDAEELAGKLDPGDVLFIDTSHEVKPANDVAFIFGSVLPRIRAGVIVHIHDIFLPYEYPRQWVIEGGCSWGEQYIVQAMLMSGGGWEVLWPGYYLQRTLAEFDRSFPHRTIGLAHSLWLQKQGKCDVVKPDQFAKVLRRED